MTTWYIADPAYQEMLHTITIRKDSCAWHRWQDGPWNCRQIKNMKTYVCKQEKL